MTKKINYKFNLLIIRWLNGYSFYVTGWCAAADHKPDVRAGLAKLGSPISDKKSLVFTAHSAKESNDETTQKESHSRFQG